VVLVELAQLEREPVSRPTTIACKKRCDHADRVAAAQRRLQAELDENAKLRKQLEDAQAKLDAIANIERNLTRKTAPRDLNSESADETQSEDPGRGRRSRTAAPAHIRLRAENYDVEAVENGMQALAASTRFRPDLVISDLRMDQLDGIGLLKELRASLAGPQGDHADRARHDPDAVQATQMEHSAF